MLMKDIGWFDSKDKSPGVLTNVLLEDISSLNGLTTEAYGIIVEAALGMIVSAGICFYFNAELGTVVTAVSPLMILGGLGMSKLQFNQRSVEDSYKHANALLSDIVINYRTIISFGPKSVDFILGRYGELLIIPHESGVKRAHVSGLFFGYSQSIRFIFIAFVFYVAWLLIKVNNLTSDQQRQQVFTGCYVVFVGSIGSGVSMSQLPSISKAQNSARKVFGMIEEPTKINPKQKGSKAIDAGQI
jgi:ABC-type multidrug transport system fused ATPase/permease subunit